MSFMPTVHGVRLEIGKQYRISTVFNNNYDGEVTEVMEDDSIVFDNGEEELIVDLNDIIEIEEIESFEIVLDMLAVVNISGKSEDEVREKVERMIENGNDFNWTEIGIRNIIKN